MRQICIDHLSGDVSTPCAWPGCDNGIPADSFVHDTASGAVRSVRVSLDAYDGQPRYFWRGDNAGWWSIANNLQFREVALIQRRIPSLGERAYHYTNASAFKLIVEEQELWLSDYRFLNDASEIRHGLGLAQEVFDDVRSASQPECDKLFGDMLALPAADQPRIYLACFSLERDSLTQWKAYGERALGVSFGIHPIEFVTAAGTAHTSRFAPVIYHDQDKRHLIRSFVHDWSLLFSLDLRERPELRIAYERVTRLYFFELLAMLKHDSFQDEREYRMIYLQDSQMFSDFSLDVATTRYRSSGSLIVPFTTTRNLAALRHAQPKLGSRIAIRDVVVGPHPLKELAVAGIRDFLTAHGYDSVVVEPSRVPFR